MVRSQHDVYLAGLFWILRERAGSNGGWPPRDIDRVCGWAVVRMLARLADKNPREVAADVIEHALHMDDFHVD